MPLPNGPAIKAIRQAKGWTGVALADAVGISHGHLFNMENPDRHKCGSEQKLQAIADTLGVPITAVTMPAAVKVPTPRRRRPAIDRTA